MPLPIFTGTATFLPQEFDSATFGIDSPRANQLFTLPFATQAIRWNDLTNTPTDLWSRNLSYIYERPELYEVTTTMRVHARGEIEWPLGFQQPGAEVTFLYPPGRQLEQRRYGAVPVGDLTSNRWTHLPYSDDYFQFNDEVTDDLQTRIRFFAWGLDPPFGSKQWRRVTVEITLYISVRLRCVGENLNDPVCLELCGREISSCFEDRVSFCFDSTDRIKTDPDCQQYFQNYVEQQGPTSQLDAALLNYCDRFTGFSDLTRNGTEVEKQLCACSLEQSQYDALGGQLFDEFPGYSNIGMNRRCLFPDCAKTPYKTIRTATCDVPDCINFFSWFLNGTFDRSSITVNQEIEGCGGLTQEAGPTDRPQPPPPPPRTNQLPAILLLVAVAIVLLVLMIVLFV